MSKVLRNLKYELISQMGGKLVDNDYLLTYSALQKKWTFWLFIL